MSAHYSLGLARLDELPRLAVLSRDQVEHGLRWHYTPAKLAQLRRQADHEFVVARSGTRPVGCVVMKIGLDTAHLVLLVVDAPYRRHGMATALMEWVEEMSRDAGVFDIDLEVRASNAEAQQFYRRRGYRPVRLVRGYYNGMVDAIRMRVNLRLPAPFTVVDDSFDL